MRYHLFATDLSHCRHKLILSTLYWGMEEHVCSAIISNNKVIWVYLRVSLHCYGVSQSQCDWMVRNGRKIRTYFTVAMMVPFIPCVMFSTKNTECRELCHASMRENSVTFELETFIRMFIWLFLHMMFIWDLLLTSMHSQQQQNMIACLLLIWKLWMS